MMRYDACPTSSAYHHSIAESSCARAWAVPKEVQGLPGRTTITSNPRSVNDVEVR